jgi:hypothetical protein
VAAGRNRSLVVPREHGAWGILLVPLVTGAMVGYLSGGSGERLIPLCIVALALFWLRTPVESWAGASPNRARTPAEFRLVRNAAVGLSATAAAGLVWLFWGWRNVALLWVGGVAALAFLLQAIVRRIWRGARTAAQMVGSAGLTATAAAAYYVVTGKLDITAWTLWAANLLFALNQIQFVQLRIHAPREAGRSEKLRVGAAFLAAQGVLILLLAGACAAGAFRWSAALAFVPLLARGFAWFSTGPRPLAIHALGKRELLYSCIFGVLLVAGMRLP